MYTLLNRVPTAYKWLFVAGLLLILFLVYTAIFSTNVLLYPTLRLEQLLLHRPITRVDCVINRWKVLGTAPAAIFLTLLLSLGCLWLGYRKRVLPYLFLLLMLGIGVEYIGKDYFPQTVPNFLQRGMDSLACPQIAGQPRSVKLMVMLGIWWEAPSIPPKRLQHAKQAAGDPLDSSGTYNDFGYPSGHTIRWLFIGLIACWLIWRQVRHRFLRWLLMYLSLTIALGGGFTQLYLGSHLITDVIAGYLFGGGTACCAIGLLLLNETRSRFTM